MGQEAGRERARRASGLVRCSHMEEGRGRPLLSELGRNFCWGIFSEAKDE